MYTTFTVPYFLEAYNGRAYLPKEDTVELKKQKLTAIPSDLPNPDSIRVLSLFNNDIEEITNLERYKNLEEIDLTWNNIESLKNFTPV